MRNTIAIETRICWGEDKTKTYELSIGLQGEDLNPDAVIEEIRAKLAAWVLTWLRQNCTISIKQRETK